MVDQITGAMTKEDFKKCDVWYCLFNDKTIVIFNRNQVGGGTHQVSTNDGKIFIRKDKAVSIGVVDTKNWVCYAKKTFKRDTDATMSLRKFLIV